MTFVVVVVVVTVCLSSVVSEIFNVAYITEIYRPGTMFLPLIVWGRLNLFTQPAPEKKSRVRWCVTVVQGHPRSLKLVTVSIQSTHGVCNFLLVFHCNVPIFCHFRDITIYWSKICVFRHFTHSISSEALARLRVPLWRWYKSWSQKSRLPGLRGGKTDRQCKLRDPMSIFVYFCLHVTDGATYAKSHTGWARQKTSKLIVMYLEGSS